MVETNLSAHDAAVLERNVAGVRARLAAAARRAGRDPSEIDLVVVTKGASVAAAAQCARLGLLDLGESRADALEAKAAALERAGLAVRWHFLGHLQRNKARRVASRAHAIHSLDSLALLESLARLAQELERPLEAYVELRLGAEASRTGLAREELAALVAASERAPSIALRGLMTMAPLVEGPESERLAAARSRFRELRAIARELEADPALAARFVERRVRTSMGMSGDFEVAIEEGSDCVRVGSAVFEGLAHLDDRNGPAGRNGRSAA